MLWWPAGLLPTQADMPHPHTLLRAARGCFVLCFHDECYPLSRPLPLHLAKLAQEYVLPFAPAPAPAARAALRVARDSVPAAAQLAGAVERHPVVSGRRRKA
jgi:hypothetical protein